MIYLCEQLFLHSNILSFLYKIVNLPPNEGFAWWFPFTSAHHRHYSRDCLLVIGQFIFIPELHERQADRVHNHNITKHKFDSLCFRL